MINFNFKEIFDFQKYGDKLLFALAFAALAGGLLHFWPNKEQEERPESTVVFTQWWQNELDDNLMEDLISKFESLHSGINIVLDSRSYDNIWQYFFGSDPETAQIQGDVYALDPLWIPELLRRETIENPTPALISFINVLYYNIDILTEAGFSRPPRNRSEFTAYSHAVAGMGIKGLAMEINAARGIYDDIFPWIRSAGAVLISNRAPTVSTAPIINSISFLAALNSEDLILHSGTTGKVQNFIEGRTAFMVAPAMMINLVREQMGDDSFSITSIPVPDNYAGRTLFSSLEWALALGSESAYKAEAQLFINFLLENAPLFQEATGVIPSSKIPANDPFFSKVWEIELAGENAYDFFGMPWVAMDGIFREELDTLFRGESTPAEIAASIQRRWGAILHE